MSVTTDQYAILDDAFKYFNGKLFEGKLPDILITLNRLNKRTKGYHWFEKFQGRKNKKQKLSEIALNPDFFDEDYIEILDTLVHEMTHQWQNYFGNPSRAGYHNWEWANKMKEIGLQPSSTGEVGGKEVGQRMDDYIISGGQFEIVAGAFLLQHKEIEWSSIKEPDKEKKERNKTREKFVCKKCMQSVQAKKTANIVCGDCMEKMVIEKEDD